MAAIPFSMAHASQLNDEIRALNAAAESDHSRDKAAARKKAMDLLARREHASDELLRKLEKAGFERDTAEEAIARLAEEGLQSNERFVYSFIQSRINQGKGPRRIRADLGERGVTSAAVEEALEAADPDWVQLAADARERKFGDGKPEDFKEKARQMRFLEYRGFESEQNRRVLDR